MFGLTQKMTSMWSGASEASFARSSHSSRRSAGTSQTPMTDIGTSTKLMGPDTRSAGLALARDFPPIRYTGLTALKKVVDTHRDKLHSNGGDGNQHVAFDNVSQEVFEKIERKRLELVMKATLSYFPDIETLIVKISTQPHEKAHGQLGQLILVKKIAPMNLDLNAFAFMGSTTKKGPSGSRKESDSAWRNANVRSHQDDFPCLVIEAGMSESLARLRSDARWWIESSAGRVNIVLIIWVSKATMVLHIEKYVPDSPLTRTSPRLPRPVSANLTATVVIDCAASPTTVTGAPLVLEFNGVFDRPPNPPLEGDIVLTMHDLESFGNDFWVGI